MDKPATISVLSGSPLTDGDWVRLSDYEKLHAKLGDSNYALDKLRGTAGDLADENEKLRAELAELRAGFDPKVIIPEIGQRCIVLRDGGIRFQTFVDELEIHPWQDEVTRWWPLPGGAK